MQHNGRYFANNALHKTLFCTELNYTAQALTRLNGHRKDRVLEWTGHRNQNSSVLQKELYLASPYNEEIQQQHAVIQRMF